MGTSAYSLVLFVYPKHFFQLPSPAILQEISIYIPSLLYFLVFLLHLPSIYMAPQGIVQKAKRVASYRHCCIFSLIFLLYLRFNFISCLILMEMASTFFFAFGMKKRIGMVSLFLSQLLLCYFFGFLTTSAVFIIGWIEGVSQKRHHY